MRIGFTGTQTGMTVAQRFVFVDLLKEFKPEALHHGDCVGADAGAHSIACDVDVPIVIHPPVNPYKRAYCQPWAERRNEKGYLDRNRDIVNETQVLVAAPGTVREILRSGTWSTVRYARRLKRPICIIYPDGSHVWENK